MTHQKSDRANLLAQLRRNVRDGKAHQDLCSASAGGLVDLEESAAEIVEQLAVAAWMEVMS